MSTDKLIDNLLALDEPSVSWKVLVNVLGKSSGSRAVRDIQKRIPDAKITRQLLCQLKSNGIAKPKNVYGKWQGAHWIMAVLADLGYPRGDKRLVPVRDQLLAQWLGETYYTEFVAETKRAAYRGKGVPVMQGRHRRCASQQSNALWSILKLGLENEETHTLVERLLYWQWPDGGWNCDKNPDAHHSSFMESILPLRALALYGEEFNHKKARAAAKRAADVFLKRQLYLGQHSGKSIKAEFTQLHYPLYWHYDILHGLKVMAESGFVKDKRCKAALDLLERKRLPDGGWPAEKKYYRVDTEVEHGNEYVDWGGTSKKVMSPWVTVDALYVLKEAGRLRV